MANIQLKLSTDLCHYFQLDLLFLKLQHMEKTKYITANDFFPINYAMLYNVSSVCVSSMNSFLLLFLCAIFCMQMGAAIVTHMMILLQFQQWEDSQKLLSPTENSTALVNVNWTSENRKWKTLDDLNYENKEKHWHIIGSRYVYGSYCVRILRRRKLAAYCGLEVQDCTSVSQKFL